MIGIQQFLGRAYVIYYVSGPTTLFFFGHLESHNAVYLLCGEPVALRDALAPQYRGGSDEDADIGQVLKAALKEQGTLHHGDRHIAFLIPLAERFPFLCHTGPYEAVETLGLMGTVRKEPAYIIAFQTADKHLYLSAQ